MCCIHRRHLRRGGRHTAPSEGTSPTGDSVGRVTSVGTGVAMAAGRLGERSWRAHGSEQGDLASRRASVGMGAVMAASGLDERPWRGRQQRRALAMQRGRRQRRALARQRRREQTLRPRQRQAAASSPPTNADEIPQVEKQGIFARSLSSKAKWLSTFPCLLESDSYCTGTFGEPNLLLQSLVEVSLRFCCGGWDILRPLSADMPVLAMQDATMQRI